jgi:hypothetical protein
MDGSVAQQGSRIGERRLAGALGGGVDPAPQRRSGGVRHTCQTFSPRPAAGTIQDNRPF